MPYRGDSSFFYQDLDGNDYLQWNVLLEGWNLFISVMKCLYVILVKQTHCFCTISCKLDETLEKLFVPKREVKR